MVARKPGKYPPLLLHLLLEKLEGRCGGAQFLGGQFHNLAVFLGMTQIVVDAGIIILEVVSELVEDGLIELTIPEKPNSRLQKYRLTEKGRAIFS